MSAKTILMAIADPQALADISQALGTEWMPTAVRNEPEALAQLKKYSFTAFLVDFNLGSPDASALLEMALTEHPETTRFLLAYEADLALVAAKVNGPHHILPKPIEFGSLRSRVEEGVAQREPNARERGSDAEQQQKASASIPAIYAEVIKAFETPGVTSGQIGELIARDEALSAEVLRLASSSYLGLPRNLSRPEEAVESLGLDAVKALVMALRHLAEHRHLKPGYLSFDDLWEHSKRVAQIARDLVLSETKDRALATEAFAAGLVHDFGKVVLVTNFDDLYGRVHSLARNQPVTLWNIEKEMFGANHGEIGGCLVGMWNLPFSVVEATALHHEPPVEDQGKLTTLAAVHIADVLVHQLWPKDEFRVPPTIDTNFLRGLGLHQRLPVWRAAFANRNFAGQVHEHQGAAPESSGAPATVVATAAQPQTADQFGGEITPTRTATAAPPPLETTSSSEHEETAPQTRVTRLSRRLWVYTGVAAIALLLSLWLGSRSGYDQPERVEARTPALTAPASDTTAATSDTQPAAQAAEPDQPAPEVAPLPVPAPNPPDPQPIPAAAPTEMVKEMPSLSITPPATIPTAAAPVEVVKKKSAEFRLKGIFYTVSSPTAMVNGVTVHVGDKVDGATVIKIGRSDVTLQIESQYETLSLK